MTSFYYKSKSLAKNKDWIEATLKLNEDCELETMEGELLHLSVMNEDAWQLAGLRLSRNYLFRLSLDVQNVQAFAENETREDIVISSLKLKR